MIEGLTWCQAADPGNDKLRSITYHPTIRRMLEAITDKKKREEAEKLLVYMTFTGNVYKTSKAKPRMALGLKGDAAAALHVTLTRMFADENPRYNVNMWFLNRHSHGLELFGRNYLNPIAAVQTWSKRNCRCLGVSVWMMDKSGQDWATLS